MKKYNLEFFNSKPISDIFIATVVQKLSEEDTIKFAGEKLLEGNLEESAKTFQFNGKNISIRVLRLVEENFYYCVIVKDEDKYIRVNDGVEVINLQKFDIKNIEPFSDYYSENEYRWR